MNILRKHLRNYKTMLRQTHHDGAWDNFMGLRSSEAFGYALSNRQPLDKEKEIMERAREFLKVTEDQAN